MSRWFVNEGSMGKVLCVYRSVITAALVNGSEEDYKKKKSKDKEQKLFR